MKIPMHMGEDVNTGTVQTNTVGGSWTTVNSCPVEAGHVYIAQGYVQWTNGGSNVQVQIALECLGNNTIIESISNGTLYTTGTPAIVGILKPNANGNINLRLQQFSGSSETLKLNELKVYKLR